MNYAYPVRRVNSPGQRRRQTGSVRRRLRRVRQLFVEAAAAYILQREEGLAIVCANLEDLNDCWVLTLCDNLSFVAEAGEVLGIC